jgi:YebC/PmpR family DNA-binding regulatory protein
VFSDEATGIDGTCNPVPAFEIAVIIRAVFDRVAGRKRGAAPGVPRPGTVREPPHAASKTPFRQENMAGHSKWANIQHRKGAQDKKRGKLFTKLIREITTAARMGGGDIESNPRLRLAIDKAKAQSMPKDNIERAIKRGSGAQADADYQEIRYEGYGPRGTAVIVDCLTDNRNRTVADVRHAFSKFGGNLGADGSVAYLFNHVGQLFYPPGCSEERVMEAAIEAGAEDVLIDDDGSIEVLTDPADYEDVRAAMVKVGLEPDEGQLTMRASTSTSVEGDDALATVRMLEMLEDLDDVQEVYSNAELSADALAGA